MIRNNVNNDASWLFSEVQVADTMWAKREVSEEAAEASVRGIVPLSFT